MSDLAKLVVSLEAQTAKYHAQLETANRKLDGFAKRQEASIKKLSGIFNSVLAVAASGSFAVIIKNSIDAANRLNDLNARLGTTVEGLSRLEYAAELSGVSAGALTTGLQRMTRRIAEAANGTGEAVKALEEMDLSATKLKQLRPEQQFEVLADALEKVPDQADKVRLAMKILDSEGVALLQTMKGGSEAIRKLGAESDRVGRTISTEFAVSATEANAAIKRLEAANQGLANQLAVNVGPTVAELANWLAVQIPESVNLAGRSIDMLAAGALESLSKLVEFIRVPTYYLGFISDEAFEADKRLYEMQKNLSGAAGVIFEEIEAASRAMGKFNAETQSAALNLNDFRGGSQGQTDAAPLDQSAINYDSLMGGIEVEENIYQGRWDMISKMESSITDLVAREEEKRAQLREMFGQQVISSATGVFSQITALTRQALGEDSAAYKAAFLGQQTLLAAQTIMSAEAAATAASAPPPIGLGPVAGPPYGQTLRALGYTSAGIIMGQGFAGLFDKGGFIPPGKVGIAGEIGPELIQGPAHVTSRLDTAKMMNQSQEVNLRNIVVFDDDAVLDKLGSRRAEKIIITHVKKNMRALQFS